MNGQLIHFESKAVKAVLHKWHTNNLSTKKSRLPRGSSTGQPKILGELEGLEQIGEAMIEGWKWTWTTNVQDDLNRAVEMLEHNGR